MQKNSDYRDFVLSRIMDKPEITLPGEQGVEQDKAWQKRLALKVVPTRACHWPSRR